MMTYLSLLHLACSPMDTQVVLEEVEDASFHVQAENGGDGTDFDPLAFVTPLSAAPLETTDGDNQLGVVQILTDLSTKESVELQSFGSWTRITDLDDGEVLDVAGDFVGTFDNLSYTAWMEEKRAADEAVATSDASYALSGSGSFSIASSFKTPKYSKTGANSVKTTMSSLITYNPNSNSIKIELFRSVSFWFDANYGSQEYWVDYNTGGGGSKTWTNAKDAGSYYLKISIPTYTGIWAEGNYRLAD